MLNNFGKYALFYLGTFIGGILGWRIGENRYYRVPQYFNRQYSEEDSRLLKAVAKELVEIVGDVKRIADTNRDGALSLQEKLVMYKEMGINLKDSQETRQPTIREMVNYIKTHEREG